jgi:hypothetical protein
MLYVTNRKVPHWIVNLSAETKKEAVVQGEALKALGFKMRHSLAWETRFPAVAAKLAAYAQPEALAALNAPHNLVADSSRDEKEKRPRGRPRKHTDAAEKHRTWRKKRSVESTLDSHMTDVVLVSLIEQLVRCGGAAALGAAVAGDAAAVCRRAASRLLEGATAPDVQVRLEHVSAVLEEAIALGAAASRDENTGD